MQQGMLSSVLLSLFLVFWPTNLSATEMEPERAEQWLRSEQIHQKVGELLQYVIEDSIDSLDFSLERLALPQQEVARYLLLKKLEQQNIILTPKMAIFVEEQKRKIPTYQILERNDGYEFSVPAFNYPAVANRLMKRWEQDQSTLDFVLKAERNELDLKTWLSGSEYQKKTREALLIRELDSLSPNAITTLTNQLTDELVTSWLPSTQVMVRLAQVSEDPQVYKLLWLMKTDDVSRGELDRLAMVADEFALQQIMLATHNPSLKQQALRNLTRIKPMSTDVKAFLISRMALKEDVTFVARELANQGYTSWLEELVTQDKSVKDRAILQVLSP